MPATYSIFEGGNGRNANNAMFPSSNNVANPPQGYADHQKSRRYSVSRWLDFRRKQNFGSNSRVDDATTFYFNQLKDAGTPVVNTDILRLHLLLPKTKLLGLFYEIVTPAAGFLFSIGTEIGAIVGFAGVNGAVAGFALNDALAAPLLAAQDYVILTATTVPTGGFVDSGLLMYVTAVVEDYNNGNE